MVKQKETCSSQVEVLAPELHVSFYITAWQSKSHPQIKNI